MAVRHHAGIIEPKECCAALELLKQGRKRIMRVASCFVAATRGLTYMSSIMAPSSDLQIPLVRNFHPRPPKRVVVSWNDASFIPQWEIILSRNFQICGRQDFTEGSGN
jgi:hypothetical protein